MEEKQKVWIRGRKGCGKEIVKILERLGATNEGKVRCEDEDTIYFINHKNRISCVFCGSEFGAIVMDNYKEIKLPEQEWKDGDVLVCDEFPWDYAVFKKYLEDDMFEAYFIINEDGVSFNATEPVKIYHLANEKEFEDVAKMLFTASRNMFEVGKKLERKNEEL